MADKDFRARIIEGLQTNALVARVKPHLSTEFKRRVLRAIAGDKTRQVDLGHGASFLFSLSDFYWSSYGGNILRYEPEIWSVVEKFADADTAFIDGGSNIGLWSCVAASRIGNPERVVAVEPGTGVLPMLHKNRAANNNGFTIVEKAMWNSSGQSLRFSVNEAHATSGVTDSLHDSKQIRLGTRLTCRPSAWMISSKKSQRNHSR